MVFIVSSLLLGVLLCGSLFGQSANPSTRPQTFHVKGTITDPNGGVVYGVKVAFQSEGLTKAVLTNGAGVYETDLPLGDYTMTAQSQAFRPYRRPLFRLTEPANLIFDITLRVRGSCDVLVFNSSGKVTPEDWVAAQSNACLREDSFLASSGDGAPFQLFIAYGSRATSGSVYSYAGEKTPNATAVFATYNLFSLQADKIIYDDKNRMIEASGNVVVVNEPGTVQRADAITFKIADGQAIPTTRLQTFHVKGTIALTHGAVVPRASISFQSKGFDKTVTANEAGVYEGDLPLGIYRMSAQSREFRTYNRPLLRAISPKPITLGVTVYPFRNNCDLLGTFVDGKPLNLDETRKNLCGGEDSFPDSSDRDPLFQLYIRYPKRKPTDQGYDYGGDKLTAFDFDIPVFVEYNVFSLQAKEVIYNVQTRIIKAIGNVVVMDESGGATQRAKSMSFQLKNGQATLLR
jgi:lipopolysaccharide export system protein LptA